MSFTGGQRITAAQLNLTTGGSYTTTFVPTWSQSGGSPAIGNGSIVTSYTQIGKTCIGHYQFIFGSTTNFGTGSNAWNFSLPVAPVAPLADFFNIGSWSALSATNFYSGSAYMNTSGAMGLFTYGSSTSVMNTNPATWVSGNYLMIDFAYQTT